ncbi:MAG: glycine--tRNA ligase subunit alpha/beta [Anaerolineae bacterium]|nr:MAG: glycine--tRNA ligase subunit alpha/beta [Anaerolineae bacterium]WKZ43664.1 MAG: glycine--tRNA ligase subunit beta [Anaerolineales bacterium]
MPSSLQSIILTLQQFWADHGCLITQPYYTQVGAGTMNPATFLRVLGPEPWNVAYVEPSVRPDDGRYGENPNRFQKHTQFQVILKPDTGNPQELYLDSLKALGIDPRQHDIRFVEDNWEQPAIAAWGLGWEVWLDGQEITQFTYFQQMGGVTLNPVSVEITYGLERILIALNNAKAIWDEEWGAGVTYGEIIRREEFEHSKYYYEVADIARARQMYDLFSAEADACLAQGLLLPAHDYVLKSSHTFNILDARGAISVAERQAFFRRMRELARKVAEGYEEQRKELEYPLLKDEGGRMKDEVKPSTHSSFINHPSSFVFEIGTEELPASDVDSAHAYLTSRIPSLFDELHLEHGDIRIYATPRRLVITADSLSPTQPDREEVVKGPPADKAFDKDGIALPAGMGFAKKNNVDTKDLEVREQDGGKYVFAVVKQKGRPTPEVLSEALPKLIESIKFEKSMRWNDSGVSFSRPIRWYMALFGETVIPFEYAGVTSGNTSRGLRPYDSPEIKIPSADKYLDLIREAGIILDKEERKASIVEQVNQAASLVGGEAIFDFVGATHESPLLNEVANLVEIPTAVMGGFDNEYLSLPRDVLISVMKKHQRYFPIQRVGATLQAQSVASSGKDASQSSSRSAQGESPLLANFIAIRNGDDIGIDIVRQGNEHVLSARFADANFFVREDLKHKLEEYRPKLSSLTFHTKLGSMLDKSDRILKLGAEVGGMLGFKDMYEVKNLGRAAYLAKADLVTQMVTEMTSLQGIIGGEYALRSGEEKEVARGIAEQYQTVPGSKIGLAVALADRLDSLVGFFAAGLAPTGAKDPFGLRRAAIGIVQPLIEHDLDFNLALAVKKSAKTQPIEVDDEIQKQILEFIAGRLRVALNEAGYKHDVVDAVLAEQSANPAASAEAVKQLQSWVGRGDWSTILPAFARCVRITRDQTKSFKVNEKGFVEKEEKDLFAAVQKNVKHQPSTVDEFLNIVVALIPSINAFFDKVLVMAEDKKLQENRLGLLQQIAGLSKGIADLSKLEGF